MRTKLLGMPINVKLHWLPMLLVLGMLQTACATKSTDLIPVQCPTIPALPPVLEKPIPPESFLDRAQKSIEEWRKKLTGSVTK